MANPQSGFWLLPSRKRPHNLKRFFQALRDTKTSTHGLVLIKREEFDLPGLAAEYEQLEVPDKWKIVRTNGDSQGDKLRETKDIYFNCDWAGLIGDDQVPLTDNWDLKLIEWIKGWNLVTCHDDGWQINTRGPNHILEADGRICGAWCVSGELLRTVGYIFPPNIHHIYLDDIWEELGKNTGCWNFVEHSRADVIVAHHHVDRGRATKDETHRRAYEGGDSFAAIDYPHWWEWRRNELGPTIDRVRELMVKLMPRDGN